MSGIGIAIQPLPLNTYLDHNNMLRKNMIFSHLRFFSRNQRLLLTVLLLIYLSAVSILSPVLAASLIRRAPLPLQFTSTVPETFTTSLQVTVPVGATGSTLTVNCYDCDHTDWGSLSINGRASIAIWPGPGPGNASGMIYIPVPVSAWRTGTNTLAFTHSQYTGGRVDALTVTFTTTSPPSPSTTTTAPSPAPIPPPTLQPTTPPSTSPPPPINTSTNTTTTPPLSGTLPLQFTATTPETFTTSLQATVPTGAIGSTLTVNCYDCDHTDWGSLSVNGGAAIAIWPGPGPSNASGMIRIPVPVSAWRSGSNTLAFTHSQYSGGRVDALTLSFTTTSPPPTSTTTSPTINTTTPPPTNTSPPPTNTSSGTTTPTTTTSTTANTSSGTTTSPTAAPPQITSLTSVTASGLTVTCANQPASIRYQTDLSSTIMNPVSCNPTYSLVRKWVSGETFICVYARDAAGVENPIDYRCVPSPTTTTSSTTSSTTNQSATLSWTLGTDTNLAGYKVYVGTASGSYNYPGSPFTLGMVNTYTMSSLPIGQTYFFAISAYDASGNESALSAEVSKSIY